MTLLDTAKALLDNRIGVQAPNFVCRLEDAEALERAVRELDPEWQMEDRNDG